VTSSRPITEDELHAFVDQRLDAARHAEVEDYLNTHPEVAARMAHYGRHRNALRAALAHVVEEPVPPQLNIRHLMEMGHQDRGFPWRSLAASVLMLVIGAAGGWTLRGEGLRPSDANGIASLAQEAAYTYGVFGSDQTHPVEFGAADKNQLVRWISSRLGRSVTVPDLTASGYRFMGGRLVATPHGPAGLLMYDDDQGRRLAMLVRPMTIDADTRMSEHSFGDLRGYAWASKGTGFSLVGAAPADLLHPIADEVRRQEAGRI
jgi:anti-sigma factor RsiW